MDLLKFSTAGSVDDGKSTLIGRLLFDTNSIAKDQIEAVLKASQKKGNDFLDLALLTDGLKAEREQGITIDVSYKYFSSGKRKFIISDCPGHAEYTRNLVTGASDTELIVLLIDARKGVIEQTKRHYFIAKMMGIGKFIICVNKMDLVDNSEAIFKRIKSEFSSLLALDNSDIKFIPTSALNGDNIVKPSKNLSWYSGPTVYESLEKADIENKNNEHFRFPVQYVIRNQSATGQDFRGFSGRVDSGSISVGESVTVYPKGNSSKIKDIHVFDQSVNTLEFNEYGTVLLEDDIDVSRGDLLLKSAEEFPLRTEIDALLCWMDSVPFADKFYILKFGTNETRCKLTAIVESLNIDSLEFEIPANKNQIVQNQIVKAAIKVAQPIAIDAFYFVKRTGCFVLIDEQSNMTVASGIVE